MSQYVLDFAPPAPGAVLGFLPDADNVIHVRWLPAVDGRALEFDPPIGIDDAHATKGAAIREAEDWIAHTYRPRTAE